MTTNTAIVDDRDPLIQYAGTWNGAGTSSEFYSTTTWSPRQGSTASLSFVGTSVTVYGSVGLSNAPESSLAFAVDDSVTGIYTPPSDMTTAIHHEALWTSPTLSNGSHTLIITQTAAQTSGVIFLDYIMYNTTSTSRPYFVDDRDSRITYTPAWVQEGSDEDFQHTCQRTSSAGDSFTLEFEGQSVSFYGGNTSPTQNASVEIDGGPSTFFGAPTDATTTNNLLFHVDDLPAGKHTLVVTAQNDEHVWTDYFIVNANAASLSSGSPSSSISPSTPSALTSTTPSSIISPKPTPTGAIVGGVIGALVILIALAIAMLLFRRRRRNRPPTLPILNALQPTPFATFMAPAAAPGLPNVYHDTTTGYSSSNLGTSTSQSLANPFIDPMSQPTPVQPGLLPSSKLLREAQLSNMYSQSRSDSDISSGAGSSRQEEPPQYTA